MLAARHDDDDDDSTFSEFYKGNDCQRSGELCKVKKII